MRRAMQGRRGNGGLLCGEAVGQEVESPGELRASNDRNQVQVLD